MEMPSRRPIEVAGRLIVVEHCAKGPPNTFNIWSAKEGSIIGQIRKDGGSFQGFVAEPTGEDSKLQVVAERCSSDVAILNIITEHENLTRQVQSV
jgi:hypothetical protein